MKLYRKTRSLSIRNTLVGGAAGLVATLPMSAAMGGINRLLPFWKRGRLPPRKITARIASKLNLQKLVSGKENKIATTAAHFGFGAATGAVYGNVSKRIPTPFPLSGVLFGLAVWSGSYFGWLPAVGLTHPEEEHRDRHAMMAFAHVVWGASMGMLFERFATKLGENK